MIPTRRLALFAWLATAIAIVAGYVPEIDLAMYALDGVLVTAALADLAFAAGRRVEAQREVAAIFSVTMGRLRM